MAAIITLLGFFAFLSSFSFSPFFFPLPLPFSLPSPSSSPSTSLSAAAAGAAASPVCSVFSFSFCLSFFSRLFLAAADSVSAGSAFSIPPSSRSSARALSWRRFYKKLCFPRSAHSGKISWSAHSCQVFSGCGAEGCG